MPDPGSIDPYMDDWDVSGPPSAPLVLIVDDSQTARELVRQHLIDTGYRVAGAVDGDAALALARLTPPDVVLLDTGVPGELSGVRLLDALHADPLLTHIPVIVVRNDSDHTDPVTGLEHGALDYVDKPVNLLELEARCAAALRLKRAHDELVVATARLEDEALTDALTGLANRRRAMDELVRTIAAARRHGRPVAVMQVDLDHFHAVNETHGRGAGDAVLGETGARLMEQVRAGDLVARVGGEEFLVVLNDVSPRQVPLVGDRLRRSIESAPFEVEGASVPVTTSIGWAVWQGETPEELLDRADRALAEAKAAGRNAVHPLS